MELKILNLLLLHREAVEKVLPHLSLSKKEVYSREIAILIPLIVDYYRRDPSVTHVDRDILLAIIEQKFNNNKHIQVFRNLIDEALGLEVSAPNLEEAILKAKERELRIQIATGMANDEDVDELVDSWQIVKRATSITELDDVGLEVFTGIDVEELIADRYDDGSMLPIYPKVLNDKLDGGARRGHHILVYARPEAGKSAFAINAACALARRGFKGIYFSNEDRPSDLAGRILSNLSGMPMGTLREDPRRAQAAFEEAGGANIIRVPMAGGTMHQVEALVERFDPDYFIVDQIKSLTMKEDNRVLQLEKTAQAMRRLGISSNKLAISVTHAGDSADGKLFLEQGDVDFSNTGIPGAVDLMIGIGTNEEYERNNERGICLPKNKISGIHDRFVVKIVPSLSRFVSPTGGV